MECKAEIGREWEFPTPLLNYLHYFPQVNKNIGITHSC